MSEVFQVKPLRSRYLHYIRVELRLNVYILFQAEEGWLFTQLTVCCSFMYFRKVQLVHKMHNLAIGTTTSKHDRMLPLLSVNDAICHPVSKSSQGFIICKYTGKEKPSVGRWF